MSEQDRLTRPQFKVGDIILHKSSGHPYRVIHIYKFMSTVIVDLLDSSPLVQSLMLLPRNYDDYSIDRDVDIRNDEYRYEAVSI